MKLNGETLNFSYPINHVETFLLICQVNVDMHPLSTYTPSVQDAKIVDLRASKASEQKPAKIKRERERERER